jgi:predicted ATPase
LGRRDEAQHFWRDAIVLARRQEARSLELRAVTHLAESAGGDTTSEVAKLYGWFKEGLNTADLQRAARLLAG